MVGYITKRILYSIPTLIFITLLTFFISLSTPGDPVEQQLKSNFKSGNIQTPAYWQTYKQRQLEMGLNLPIFYFSFTRLAVPDTLHRIFMRQHRDMLSALIWEYGNWKEIQDFYLHTRSLYLKAENNHLDHDELKIQLTNILTSDNITAIKDEVQNIAAIQTEEYEKGLSELQSLFTSIEDSATPWKNYIPYFHWHGLNNQYHQWLFGDGKSGQGIVSGDFGKSYRNKRPVTEIIGRAILITLQITLAALLLAFLIAVPLGVYSGSKKGTFIDHLISFGLFALHGMPAFWIGTLLIIFLAGGDYLNWFPPFGLGNVEGLSFWEALRVRICHLILPVFCLVYPILAFLARQARGSTIHISRLPFIKTARAKGLSEDETLWKHNFRNALLPIITLLGNILPFAIGGSLVMEVVFSIPGMGKTSLDALYARDYPVVFAVVLITSAITILGYLLADILYALFDPRINYEGNNL